MRSAKLLGPFSLVVNIVTVVTLVASTCSTFQPLNYNQLHQPSTITIAFPIANAARKSNGPLRPLLSYFINVHQPSTSSTSSTIINIINHHQLHLPLNNPTVVSSIANVARKSNDPLRPLLSYFINHHQQSTSSTSSTIINLIYHSTKQPQQTSTLILRTQRENLTALFVPYYRTSSTIINFINHHQLHPPLNNPTVVPSIANVAR